VSAAVATSEIWFYERKRRCDKRGTRWHFVRRDIDDPAVPYDERPFELYFRNDDRTEFGLLRFEQRKDNPYRNYEAIVSKIMNNVEFRKTLLDPETEEVWRRSWK
jgi:hypothetical protein